MFYAGITQKLNPSNALEQPKFDVQNKHSSSGSEHRHQKMRNMTPARMMFPSVNLLIRLLFLRKSLKYSFQPFF